MDAPKSIEYTTKDGYKVVLSDAKQLIVAQGMPCIDGGQIKVNGKYTKLYVRYDNKPELAAEIAAWQAAWSAYNAAIADLSERIVTDSKYNFAKAESDTFAWYKFDDTSGGSLLHKPSGRSLYQMRWIDPKTGYATEPVTGSEREGAIAFWAALRLLQDRKPAYVEQDDPEPQHGQNGYCRKCHSYCYGDCQAH
jgi:hypothetical protein